jgi:hypothetical protein
MIRPARPLVVMALPKRIGEPAVTAYNVAEQRNPSVCLRRRARQRATGLRPLVNSALQKWSPLPLWREALT